MFDAMMIVFLWTMMDVVAIMMVTLAIFMPAVKALGFNQVWFCVLYLLNMEMASTTPPFGVAVFTMKAVCPKNRTMGDIYLAAMPFLGVGFLAMLPLMFFPNIILWLPSFIVYI